MNVILRALLGLGSFVREVLRPIGGLPSSTSTSPVAGCASAASSPAYSLTFRQKSGIKSCTVR